MKTPIQVFTEFNHDFGLPAYETLGAAGMDIRANEKVTLQPKETQLIKTGLFVAIPEGFEIQVRPRSGMSLKTKLRIANAPGTVDSDYRGEVCIIAENTHGSVEMHIGLGERIAQIVLQRVPQIDWVSVNSREELTKTIRGEGGFGSSGK
jgi:dUTP pyrophosphatase